MQASGLGMILILAASMVQMASSICSATAVYTDGTYMHLARMTDNFTSGDLASEKPVAADGAMYRYFNVPAQFEGMAMYAQAATNSAGAFTAWLGDGENPWKIRIDIAHGPVTVYIFFSTLGGTATGGFPAIAAAQGWTKAYGSAFQSLNNDFSRFDVKNNQWPGEAKDTMNVWSKTIMEDTEITGLDGLLVGGLLVSPGDSGCYTTTNTTTTTTTTPQTCGSISSVEGGGVTWDSSIMTNESLINGPGSDYQFISPPAMLDGAEAFGNLKPNSGTPWPFSETAHQNTDLVINYTGPLMVYIWVEGAHVGSAALRTNLLGAGFTKVDTTGFARRRLSTGDQDDIDLYQYWFGMAGEHSLTLSTPGLLVGGILRDTMTVCTTTSTVTVTTITTTATIPNANNATTTAAATTMTATTTPTLEDGQANGTPRAATTAFSIALGALAAAWLGGGVAEGQYRTGPTSGLRRAPAGAKKAHACIPARPVARPRSVEPRPRDVEQPAREERSACRCTQQLWPGLGPLAEGRGKTHTDADRDRSEGA
eukprot:CAMPEP_0195052954 /NCGR_PEP_ID=MMETSP0448-20130528/2236_1 /TAXON_ID=66468 /ORGANISM="Heterocapsa triquestra, Strain CCMP 448" /LENGTH=538 /DNA_ID=CAMNT_0040082191 /DNA_START=98 /DNA_END=1715 /DNA_ORIENTATION=+